MTVSDCRKRGAWKVLVTVVLLGGCVNFQASAAFDAEWTFNNNSYIAYTLTSVSSPDLYPGPLPANNPTLNLVAGKRYRVTFYENARRRSRSPDPPRLEVLLDGQTIVSPHLVTPVEEFDSRKLPYHFVESAVFVAPRTGALELVFTTTQETGLTVLLDHVAVEELAP